MLCIGQPLPILRVLLAYQDPADDCIPSLQFQSHVIKGNESEPASNDVVSAKQLGVSRSAAAKVAQSMAEAQRQADLSAVGSQSASEAATTMSPQKQQAAVKAAMVHAWRGVSCMRCPVRCLDVCSLMSSATLHAYQCCHGRLYSHTAYRSQ